MVMKTSKNGIELIKEFEGFRSNAYKVTNAEKYYTIGYGHYSAGVKKNSTITREEAEELLKQDLEVAERHVNTYRNYCWNQNEFDALVSFTYNIGNIHELTANGTRSRKTIADKMLEYVKSGGKVLKGLQVRRARERELFLAPAGDIPETGNMKQILIDVIDGKYGSGDIRKLNMKNKGLDYRHVQGEVNKYIAMAYEAISGTFGNGETRKEKVAATGYDYDVVQHYINALYKVVK